MVIYTPGFVFNVILLTIILGVQLGAERVYALSLGTLVTVSVLVVTSMAWSALGPNLVATVRRTFSAQLGYFPRAFGLERRSPLRIGSYR